MESNQQSARVAPQTEKVPSKIMHTWKSQIKSLLKEPLGPTKKGDIVPSIGQIDAGRAHQDVKEVAAAGLALKKPLGQPPGASTLVLADDMTYVYVPERSSNILMGDQQPAGAGAGADAGAGEKPAAVDAKTQQQPTGCGRVPPGIRPSCGEVYTLLISQGKAETNKRCLPGST